MMFVDFPTYSFNAETGELSVWMGNPLLEPTDIGYVGCGTSLSGQGSGIGSGLSNYDALPFERCGIELRTIEETGAVVVHRDGEDIDLAPGGEWSVTSVGGESGRPDCVITTTQRITNFGFQDRAKITYASLQSRR
jgi:hypothetical protein